MSSLAPARMPYASYREVNPVDRHLLGRLDGAQVSRGVSPPEAGFQTAPFAAGPRTSVTLRGSADLTQKMCASQLPCQEQDLHERHSRGLADP